MASKGRSGNNNNTRGSGKLTLTSKIGFQYAKGLNKKTDEVHSNKHKKDFGATSLTAYKQKAIKFANLIDKKNCDSIVEKSTGKTYKYNKKTNEFVVVDKNGYINTYFKPTSGKSYYKRVKDKIKQQNKQNRRKR